MAASSKQFQSQCGAAGRAHAVWLSVRRASLVASTSRARWPGHRIGTAGSRRLREDPASNIRHGRDRRCRGTAAALRPQPSPAGGAPALSNSAARPVPRFPRG